MNRDDADRTPRRTEKTKAADVLREQRRAEALRANLGRRKDQTRARAEDAKEKDPPAGA